MIFDSNVHIKKFNIDEIKKTFKKLKKYQINNAICFLDNAKKDLKKFYDICLQFKHIPVVIPNKGLINYDTLKKIKSIGYKFIKIHPRILNVSLYNKNFYLNLINKIRNNFNVIWCSLESFKPKQLLKYQQIDLICSILNIFNEIQSKNKNYKSL